MANERLNELEVMLSELDSKRAVLIQEISLLRSSLLASSSQDQIQPTIIGRASSINTPVTPDEKLNLFLKLFRCREDVYPKRWENNKTNKQGYSPACDLEWVKPICQKPMVKCSECPHQKFPKLDQYAAESHLKGFQTIGTYAIREDDSCSFLACDFDESTWKEDVLAFKQGGRDLGLDIAKDLKLANHYSKCDEDDQREISEKIMQHIRLTRLEKLYTFDNVICLLDYKN